MALGGEWKIGVDRDLLEMAEGRKEREIRAGRTRFLLGHISSFPANTHFAILCGLLTRLHCLLAPAWTHIPPSLPVICIDWPLWLLRTRYAALGHALSPRAQHTPHFCCLKNHHPHHTTLAFRPPSSSRPSSLSLTLTLLTSTHPHAILVRLQLRPLPSHEP